MPARSPEEMIRVWSEAFNRGDVEAIVALYEPGATLVQPSGPPVTGHDALRQVFAGFLGGRPRIDATTRKVVQVGDLALTLGDWTLQAKASDGKPRETTGRSTEVLRRQGDGTWRYVIDDPYSA